MAVTLLEPIPHTNVDAARMHFEHYDHVGLSGLIDPSVLEFAIDDARQLSPFKPRNRGRETIAHLRTPDPDEEEALHAVLQAMQQGAVLLGQSVMPALPGEEFQIELSEMERGTPGLSRQYRNTLIGAVAITNLRGESYQWVDGEEGKRVADYLIKPGNILIHGLKKRSKHRDYTSYDSGTRIGLSAATIARPASEITQ